MLKGPEPTCYLSMFTVWHDALRPYAPDFNLITFLFKFHSSRNILYAEVLESADHAISRPHRTPKQADVLQELNGVGYFAEEYIRKHPFGSPSSLSIRRPYENLCMYPLLASCAS